MGRTLQLWTSPRTHQLSGLFKSNEIPANFADQQVDRTMTSGGQFGKLKVLLKVPAFNLRAVPQQVIYSLVNQLSLLIVICAKNC